MIKKKLLLLILILCLVPVTGCGGNNKEKRGERGEAEIAVEEKQDTAAAVEKDTFVDEKALYEEEDKKEDIEENTEKDKEETIEEKPDPEREEEELHTIEQNYVYVKAADGYVNMRTGPGTDYEIICTIPNETALEVYPGDATAENGKKWLKIAYWTDGEWKTGWVSESQVE